MLNYVITENSLISLNKYFQKNPHSYVNINYQIIIYPNLTMSS